MQREDLTRLAKFGEAKIINTDLEKIYEVLEKELKQEKKPDSLIGRVVVDAFGLLALYVLLFVLCDFTRSALTGGDFFGFKWIFFGPYYFFTKAPLMTRVWKSKKFLEDLADVRKGDVVWPNDLSCSVIGQFYIDGCSAEQSTHRHPVRDSLGSGLDWVLSHILPDSIGQFINNNSCGEQGETIAHACASDRLQAAYDCYEFFCQAHGLAHIAGMNDPNRVGTFEQQTSGWDHYSTEAYQKYYNVYTSIYLIGSTLSGSDGTPTNLNPLIDRVDKYCFDAGSLFSSAPYQFGIPPWWTAAVSNGSATGPCYYQNNYKEHELDYWDPVVQ